MRSASMWGSISEAVTSEHYSHSQRSMQASDEEA